MVWDHPGSEICDLCFLASTSNPDAESLKGASDPIASLASAVQDSALAGAKAARGLV